MSTERLFIALPLPSTVRDQLVALYAPIAGLIWTRPEQLHLTMRFLGDVDLGLHEPLFTALARVRVEPFVLPVGGVGVFPPRGTPRVLWIGIERGHPRLFQLRQQVDDAILSTGFDLDVREFHPHITLARIKSETPPGAVAQFRRRHEAFEAAPFRAEVLHLYASELRPNGAVHTLRRSFPLTGD